MENMPPTPPENVPPAYPTPEPPLMPAPEVMSPAPMPAKSNNRTIWIIVIVILAVLLICCLVVVGLSYFGVVNFLNNAGTILTPSSAIFTIIPI